MYLTHIPGLGSLGWTNNGCFQVVHCSDPTNYNDPKLQEPPAIMRSGEIDTINFNLYLEKPLVVARSEIHSWGSNGFQSIAIDMLWDEYCYLQTSEGALAVPSSIRARLYDLTHQSRAISGSYLLYLESPSVLTVTTRLPGTTKAFGPNELSHIAKIMATAKPDHVH